jgi:branched-chain amino acid aminotransferase
MLEPQVYLHGRFIPQSQAHLTLHDAGFVMGATVTDLARTFAHRLFRWPDHVARFRQSCRMAEVSQPLADEELIRLGEDLVARNAALIGPEDDLALVVFATPGPVGYYLGEPGGPGDGPPTLGMHTFPLPFGCYVHLFTEGARLIIPTVRHVPSECVPPAIKQRSRLHWWLADRQARRIGPGSSALLLDAEGFVTETAAANFLLVQGGTVLSPPRGGVLGGISLRATLELCGELGIPFAENPLRPEECRAANEALLTSTPYGVAGVRSIDGVELPWPGPILKQLLEGWAKRVNLDVVRQILRNR